MFFACESDRFEAAMVKRGGYFDPLPTAEEEVSLQRATDGISSRIQPRSGSWNTASAQMESSSAVDVNTSSSSPTSCGKSPAAEAASAFNRVKATVRIFPFSPFSVIVVHDVDLMILIF